MSSPGEPSQRDGDLHVRAQDDLAVLALGEPVEAPVARHVESCPDCRRDLAALRHVIRAARDAEQEGPAPLPPERVWDAIAATLTREDGQPAADVITLADRTVSSPTDPTPPGAAPLSPAATLETGGRRASRRWLRPVLSVAAAAVLVAAGAVGWSIGRGSQGAATTTASEAVLAPQPGIPAGVAGRAVVHSSPDGYTLRVSTDKLPAPNGYYEVWLYNPSINQMVAVGTLGSGARGTFTVPAGIDLSAYHVVDVSAQRYDGNNTHEKSVLRGSLQL